MIYCFAISVNISDEMFTMDMTFSQLFNILLDHIYHDDGSKFTLVEISRATGISPNQLSLYKRHQHDNPTIENVVAILDFFKVPMAYLDSPTELDAIRFIKKLNEPVPQIRLRNSDGLELSEKGLMQIQQVVSWALAREKAIEKGDPEPPLPNFISE
jgi:transcriptional regulator with XRE-family HTH domain